MTRSRSKCPDKNPYGKFDLDMTTRLDLTTTAATPALARVKEMR
jgi:hypothetical protein